MSLLGAAIGVYLLVGLVVAVLDAGRCRRAWRADPLWLVVRVLAWPWPWSRGP